MIPSPGFSVSKQPGDFSDALSYFRSRRAVVFLSYCRFWEKHPFVQQSLARVLTDAGVRVFWFDGVSALPYRPTLYFSNENLHVQRLFQLPGRRVRQIRQLNLKWQLSRLNQLIAELGNPVVWIQAGFEDALVAGLPYVDVYSTFDDPYRHLPESPVCEKARLIVCQNSRAFEVLKQRHAEKLVVLPPPVLIKETPGVRPVNFPESFPQKRMGYIGSLFEGGFDFNLLEHFLQQLPDWGFLLQGRTSKITRPVVEKLKAYPNFYFRPWAPPEELSASWRAIQVCLLLYPETPSQAGAFPVKTLEALYYGIPCVATNVNKTADLESFIPRSSDPNELVKLALAAQTQPQSEVTRVRDHFSRLMDPHFHLETVAKRLTTS